MVVDSHLHSKPPGTDGPAIPHHHLPRVYQGKQPNTRSGMTVLNTTSLHGTMHVLYLLQDTAVDMFFILCFLSGATALLVLGKMEEEFLPAIKATTVSALRLLCCQEIISLTLSGNWLLAGIYLHHSATLESPFQIFS